MLENVYYKQSLVSSQGTGTDYETSFLPAGLYFTLNIQLRPEALSPKTQMDFLQIGAKRQAEIFL